MSRRPPGERLHLPGPRALWWAITLCATCLPLALLSVGPVEPASLTFGDVDFEVRKLNLMWRVTAASEVALASSSGAGGDDKGAAVRGGGSDASSASSPPRRASPVSLAPGVSPTPSGASPPPPGGDAGTLQAQVREGHAEAIVALFEQALEVPSDTQRPGAPAAELVVAHAIATAHLELAAKLGARLPAPSADIRAALVAVAPPGPAPGDRAAALKTASEVAQATGFGPRWGAFTRDRVRARVHLAAGRYDRARVVHRRLNASDDTVLSLARTLWMALLFAGVFGVVSLLAMGVRAASARAAGQPRLGWLRARFPGLGEGRAYHGDPLAVALGFSTWLVGYVVAGLVVSSIPGARASGGLAVLFQGLTGVMLAWAVIGAFSRVEPPIDAARLLGGSEVPAWRASTAALRVYCQLLPLMLPVLLLSALMAGEHARSHPIVEMMLEGPDGVQIASLGVAVVVVAPIGEELLFRGFLYRALRQHIGVGRALLVSATLFAMLHMSPAQLLPYMLLGAAFGLVFEWVGSLWAAIVLHGLWNLVVFAGVVMVALS